MPAHPRLSTLVAGASVLVLLAAGCGDDPTDQVGSGDTAGTSPSEPSATTSPATAPPATSPTVPPTKPRGGDPAAQLDERRADWDAAEIQDYTLTYDRSCFCPAGSVRVTVVDGEAVSAEWADTADHPGDPVADDWRTVDDFFQVAEDALTGADVVSIEYADLGYPTMIDIDQIREAVDDEITWTISVEP